MRGSYSEVTDEHTAVFALEEDVARLDVTVNNRLGVQIVNGKDGFEDEPFDADTTHHVGWHALEVLLQVSVVSVLKDVAKGTVGYESVSELAHILVV